MSLLRAAGVAAHLFNFSGLLHFVRNDGLLFILNSKLILGIPKSICLYLFHLFVQLATNDCLHLQVNGIFFCLKNYFCILLMLNLQFSHIILFPNHLLEHNIHLHLLLQDQLHWRQNYLIFLEQRYLFHL